jgi:hypothetical protein
MATAMLKRATEIKFELIAPNRETEALSARDIAIVRAEVEKLHAKLTRLPTGVEIARMTLAVIFCTPVVTIPLGWWLLGR